MDLSNAFEDGKTCLDRLEARKKDGKVSEGEETSTMEALKERLREEYRKVSEHVWPLHRRISHRENPPPAAFSMCLCT